MVDIQTISILIASAGVLVGVVYYVLDIRHQSENRQTDIALRLDETWESKDFLESYVTVAERDIKEYAAYKAGSPRKWMAEMQVSGFFETLGFLVRKGLIDRELVYNTFPTISTWEKLRFWIERLRKEAKSEWYYQEFEYLYNEMKKREQKLQQRGAPSG